MLHMYLLYIYIYIICIRVNQFPLQGLDKHQFACLAGQTQGTSGNKCDQVRGYLKLLYTAVPAQSAEDRSQFASGSPIVFAKRCPYIYIYT